MLSRHSPKALPLCIGLAKASLDTLKQIYPRNLCYRKSSTMSLVYDLVVIKVKLGRAGGDNIEKFKTEIEDKGLSYLSVMGAIDAAIEAERSKK